MEIVETNGVNFSTFRLFGSAKTWWRDYCLARPAGSPALTWEQFTHLFLERFLPITQREIYQRYFERLQQGSMTVTQYETRFIDLACHVLIILPIERERVRRFIEGLIQPIRLQMAKETGSEISFQEVANVARRVDMVLSQGGGHGLDKRPCHSCRFSGASSGGRDSYGRGYPSRFFQSALQVSHDASGGRTVHHQLLSVYHRSRVFGVVIQVARGRVCVPNMDGLRELILEEAHSARHSIYPGAAKMYQDLQQHYWWRRMKKEIVAYVARCLNCQQVMYEHQRPGGLLQKIEILEWKWEHVTMDLIVGFPRTQR
ncbi:uncharacterized protein [Nicotiana sylvestris]|uniref:uncharacterized protein n=1 Tax=Nicotiana sylvestris TaxID=4096 RepID=UPI00388C52FB